MQNLSKTYEPKKTESKIYQFWAKGNFFKPAYAKASAGKPFVIVIPPPNITGSLHMGHALNSTVQDILIRRRRMEGKPTLWVPGTDHAGIATQNVVEKELAKEGKTRFDLGREKFIKRVWQWKEKYGNIIIDQLKKLGCSCDWSRQRFTMDKECSEAVLAAFLHYHKKGWIYRGERVINFCPRCQTALSDIELKYKEVKGRLWFIKYGRITVATTRPETMLGDTSVAVHPEDKRYQKLIGQSVLLPLMNREIPIVADKLVDPKFGTGAVKVTPAHDPNDFEVAERNNLPKIKVIDEMGRITKEGGKYAGLDRLKAREKILKDLKGQDLLAKTQDYIYQVPHCYRCGTTVEQLLSKQWFLKMDELKKPAMEVVRQDKIKFVPQKWKRVYENWMENIKDWCISRQIWWGHQLPIWYCGEGISTTKRMGFHQDVVPQVFKRKTKTYRLRDHEFNVGDLVEFENSQSGEIFGYGTITNVTKTTVGELPLNDPAHGARYQKREELIRALKGHYPDRKVNKNTPAFIYTYKFRPSCETVIVSEKKPKKCPKCGNTKLRKDLDVLDTWFSSALWPFAVFGWPRAEGAKEKGKRKKEKISDLEYFYPTTVLTTAREILFLWVARMIFSGLEFVGKIPFETVYIHPVVLAETGKKMSKSLGTGVDPLLLIEKYGADATRFGIAWQLTGLQDLRFKEDTMVMARNFCNKIWNSARFVLTNLEIRNPKSETLNKLQIQNSKFQTAADKKILHQLHRLINSVNSDLENFRFGQAAQALYHFFWHEFCDKYIEISKSQIQNPKFKANTQKLLLYTLTQSLKLLHPFIPFITEEIWQKVPGKKEPLIISKWPK